MDFVLEHSTYKELNSKIHPQDFEILKQILNNYEFDLYPSYGYFTVKDFENIKSQAINKFFETLANLEEEELEDEHIRYAWKQVLDKFFKNYWGFKKYSEKPTDLATPQRLNIPLTPLDQLPKKPPEKVNFSENFFYIWPVICSMVITKSLIVWYGRELAIDASLENKAIFAAIIIFCYGSLFWFAWRRRKKKPKKKQTGLN